MKSQRGVFLRNFTLFRFYDPSSRIVMFHSPVSRLPRPCSLLNMYKDSVLICCHSISLEVIVKISSSSVSFAFTPAIPLDSSLGVWYRSFWLHDNPLLPLQLLLAQYYLVLEVLTTPSSASTESESKSESSSNLQLIIISTITKV
ncbi:unnamed protein product [Rhizophagus irregularis]|nr:unnamed protein product [Rhizophagus irregularis]